MESSERPEKTDNTETTTSEGTPVPPKPATYTPGELYKNNTSSAGVTTVDKPKVHGPESRRVQILAFALLFILSISSGLFGAWLFTRKDNTSSTDKQQVVLKSQGQLISNIAKTVGESVVSVEVTSTSDLNGGLFGFTQLQGTQQQSAGTGIILTSDGLIITNRHVVPSGTQKVSVTLSDGTTYDNVKVVGRTSSQDSLDIAFLKIPDTKGKALHAAQLGDSSKVTVGDSVIAIGNALGQFQNTVTSGIISGHGRSVQASTGGTGSDSENLEDLFQTDAAINEGNSGGPLVNLDGQVIGINTAVAGDAQNIGFAIPINDVSGLIKSVKETGELKRPYLGVVYVSLTDDIAKQYNLSVNRGAYIPPANVLGQETVVADGPAAKAGIKEGDIITKVDGATVDQNASLVSLLGKHSVGDQVTLTIMRSGKQMTITVTLGTAPTNN